MDPSDPSGRAIYELSREVAAGEAGAIARLPRHAPDQLPFEAATRVAGDDKGKLEQTIERWLDAHGSAPETLASAERVLVTRAGQLSPEDASSVLGLLATVESTKVLTATRQGRFGATAISGLLHESFRQRLGNPPGELGPGEPVLVTRNDYRRGLFNGDAGVTVLVAEGDGAPRLRVALGSQGVVRLFPTEALRGLIELGHAMTIHRSQGSEYQHALIVLPERAIPLLTRELLYTAMTRARRSITLFGPTNCYKAAIRRTAQRFSGIVEKLASAT